MIKNIYTWAGIGFLLTLFICCDQNFSDENPSDTNLKLSRDTVYFNVGGGMKSVEIKTKDPDWTVDYDDANWYSTTEYRDADGYEMLTFSADSSTVLETRESTLKVNAGNQSKELHVIQLGNKPAILLQKELIEVDKDTTVVDLQYVANIDFSITNTSNWISTEKIKIEGEDYLRLKISTNNTGNTRESGLVLTQVDGEYSAVIGVKQTATLSNYSPESVASVKGNKKIAVLSATASSMLGKFDISKSYDGNYLSYFQSEFQETGTIDFTYKLDAGSDPLNYIIYYPSEEAKTQSLKLANIYVKKVGETTFTKVTSPTFDQTQAKVITFDNPIENVSEIKFEVVSTYGDTGSVPAVSCAEVEFYTSAVLYSNIFTDMTYSELLSNVTMNDILNINNSFYRTIAKHLLNGTYEYNRIFNLQPIQKDRTSAKIYKASLYENYTGVYAAANEELVVFCGKQTATTPPSMVVYNSSTNTEYTLKEGINKIKVSNGGKVYIKNATSIKVHIASGVYEGSFTSSNLSSVSNLTSADGNMIDLIGTNYHLMTSLSNAKKTTASLIAAGTNLEKFIAAAQTFYGVDSGTYQAKSKLGITVNSAATTYTTEVNLTTAEIEAIKGYTSGYNETVATVLEKIGEAYEPYVDKLWSVSGVTAKLFAADYMFDNSAISIIKNNSYYATAFQDLLVTDLAYANVTNKWSQVVPLWQLNHYFKQVLGISDYYAQMTKSVKSLTTLNTNYFVHFKNYSNQIADKNFATFYDAWNITGTATVLPTTASPGGLQYYIEDNKALYQTLGSLTSGTFYASLGGKPALYNYKNLTAVEVYNSGFLARVEPYQTGSLFYVNWTSYTSNMKIVAIGPKGERINVN